MRATGMKVATGLRPCGSVGSGTARPELADVGHRAVAVPEARRRAGRSGRAARPARCPSRRLLAVLGALQRPADGDERAAGGHAPGQVAQIACVGMPEMLGRPLGRLRHAVGLAEHVGDEAVGRRRSSGRGTPGRARPSVDAARGRGASMTATSVPGASGNHVASHVVGQVVAQRAEQRELEAARAAAAAQVVREPCGGVTPPGLTDDVLDGHAAEGHEQLGVLERSTSQSCRARRTASAPPTTWGRITSTAPML